MEPGLSLERADGICSTLPDPVTAFREWLHGEEGIRKKEREGEGRVRKTRGVGEVVVPIF